MKKSHIPSLISLTCGVLLVAALGVSGSFALFYHPKMALPPQDIATPLPSTIPSLDDSLAHPLTGLPLVTYSSSTRPFAVMIDNAPEARPQYGLSRADLVYHVLVEGSITRFMAIFSSRTAERIGPVRSARPYFIRHAQDWDAVYVHSGGSVAALHALQQNPLRISDLDEFSNGAYFWRSSALVPHDLFTDSERLKEASEKRGYSLAHTVTPSWGFSNEPYPEAPTTTAVSIPYPMESMRVTYLYNIATHSYDRVQGRSAQYDHGNGARISPVNVLLVFKGYSAIPDPRHLGLIDYTDSGAGELIILTRGRSIAGRWMRAGDGPTAYATVTGRPLSLTPGQTFIEVLPDTMREQILNALQ